MPPLRLPLVRPPHNLFPVAPFLFNSIIRPIPYPLPQPHLPIHRRGTIIDEYENQSLTLPQSPLPRATELLASVTSFLKYETGTLDYLLFFLRSAFLSLARNHNWFSYLSSLSLPWLSWAGMSGVRLMLTLDAPLEKWSTIITRIGYPYWNKSEW